MYVAKIPEDEVRGYALGDGSLKAGALVGISSSTGKFVAINPTVSDNFVGIVDVKFDGTETTVDGEAWPYIKPKSGHVYEVRVSLAADVNKGDPLKFGNGALTNATGITDSAVAIAEEAITTSDGTGKVRWL